MKWRASLFFLTLLILLNNLSEQSYGVRIYPFKMNPKEHPDYERYAVSHPSLDVFDPLPQFATLRDISAPNQHLDNYTELVTSYCLDPNTTLGHVIWPRGPGFMFADNYKDFIDFIQERGLYITSVHGFSPVVAGFHPPKEVLDYLEEKLGSKWFGMANGEQDGHYFGGFAREQLPLNKRPEDQYLNFREYFHGMETILGPRLTTLLSSTYPHHQLKTGLYTLAGAETSQHGPNAQLRYAFIRGAGKQYGVIWFGNVSVYNRFGHKKYAMPTEKVTSSESMKSAAGDHDKQSFRQNKLDQKGRKLAKIMSEKNFQCVQNVTIPGYGRDKLGDPFGPTCGTSLNLMKRLMYAQMLYNSGYVSFEDGWFYGSQNDTLSPIGLIQHHAFLWTQGVPLLAQGVHVPTVAFYLDFLSGWTAPRLKQGIVFRTWNNLPYTAGDYLTDALFREIYPHYQDASFFHDETGVSSPTPYGDLVDVLLSDAPSWVLKQYDTVIVAGEISGGLEVELNLMDYVESGGHLVLTVGNLVKLPNSSFNVTSNMNCHPVPAGSEIAFIREANFIESYNMTVCDLNVQLPPSDFSLIAKLLNNDFLIVRIPFQGNDNGGTVTIFATPFAISSDQVATPSSEVDVTLPSPYPLLDHSRKMFNYILGNASIFYSENNLTLVHMLINSSSDEFLILVSNPKLKEQQLKWGSYDRDVELVQEIPLDQSEKGALGYLPDGYEDADIGKSTNTTIAGGDTRLFRVQVKQTEGQSDYKYIPKVGPKPRPKGIGLHLRHLEHSIRYEILKRPTFFQHYDSVVVDYSYLISKDSDFLKDDSQWLSQQGVTVYVDASPSINLFPTLRFVTDDPTIYNKTVASLTSLMHKMNILRSHDLIISLHNFPGDEFTNQSHRDFNVTVHYLNNLGTQLNITLHMLDTPKNPYSLMPMTRWLNENGLSAIKMVLNLALLVNYGSSYKYDTVIQSQSSLLYVTAPGWDLYGSSYGNNIPITKVNDSSKEAVGKMLLHVCTLRQCPYNSKQIKGLESPHSIQLYKLQQRMLQTTLHNEQAKNGQNLAGTLYPLMLDSVYSNLDEEFADVHFVESLLLPKSS